MDHKIYFRRLDFSGWKAARRKPSSRWSDSRSEKVIRDRYKPCFAAQYRACRLAPPGS
ncbi:MAG: hypothetical protein R6U98_17035 [Pirellulaceae bacterium]